MKAVHAIDQVCFDKCIVNGRIMVRLAEIRDTTFRKTEGVIVHIEEFWNVFTEEIPRTVS